VSAVKRQGLGIRGWGLGKYGTPLGLCLLLEFSSSGLAQNPPKDGAQANLRITVRVYDFTQLHPKSQAGATKEAAAVLGKAGIQTEWLVCAATEGQMPPACNQPIGAGELALRIVRRAKATKGIFKCSACAAAVEDAEGRGTYATLFLDCLDEMPEANYRLPSLLLGHFMAHEIGHLLLPGKDHTASGLMRPVLREEDWQLASVGALVFSPQQAERLRAEVLARRAGSVPTTASAPPAVQISEGKPPK
jgi:hypothetical protein